MVQILTGPDVIYTLFKGPDVLVGQTYTHNRANNDQERSLLAHTTVHPVQAHVPCNAPYRAYTCNEPHVHAPDPHVLVAVKVGSNTICNAPESKRLRSTLHAERITPITILLMLSSSVHEKGLIRGWWDDFRSLIRWSNPP
jgi:hypothetical protein